MADEIVVLRIFSNETEAAMARQVLEQAGVRSFFSKDDAGGMEPHLQRTGGIRLVSNRANATRAVELLKTMENPS